MDLATAEAILDLPPKTVPHDIFVRAYLTVQDHTIRGGDSCATSILGTPTPDRPILDESSCISAKIV